MFSHRLHVRDASVETLPLEDAQFDFCYVEPTAMLGGVVDLKPFGQPASLFREETSHRGMRRSGCSGCP